METSIVSGSVGPNAVAYDGSTYFRSLFGALRTLDTALTIQSTHISYTGTAAASINNGGNTVLAAGNGNLIRRTSAGTFSSVTASATDEVAIMNAVYIVVKQGVGLGLFSDL